LEEVEYRFWPAPRKTLIAAGNNDAGIAAGSLNALILHYTVGVENMIKVTFNNSLVIPINGSIELVLYTENF